MKESVLQPPSSAINGLLGIDTAAVRRFLTTFIAEKVHGAGFARAIIGLSGGIDSSLACFLAVEALGKENVLALWMPYRTSSPASRRDAHAVIEQLGIHFETVDITPMAEPLFGHIPNMTRLRQGNVMARLRMIVLYDYSESWNGLVIGTSNKTEIWLGYGTLFGDMACAINPLGDLYKTQVRQLSKALGVPPSVIAKPPTADLWAGQTDEDEIGFRYHELDRALSLLVDQGLSVQETLEHGLREDLVRTVHWRMEKYAFKRRLPVIAAIPPTMKGEG